MGRVFGKMTFQDEGKFAKLERLISVGARMLGIETAQLLL